MQFNNIPEDVQEYGISSYASLEDLIHLVPKDIFLRELERRIGDPEWLDVILKYDLYNQFERDISKFYENIRIREITNNVDKLIDYWVNLDLRLQNIDNGNQDYIEFNTREEILTKIAETEVELRSHGIRQTYDVLVKHPKYLSLFLSGLTNEQLIGMINVDRITEYPEALKERILTFDRDQLRDVLAKLHYNPNAHEFIQELLHRIPKRWAIEYMRRIYPNLLDDDYLFQIAFKKDPLFVLNTICNDDETIGQCVENIIQQAKMFNVLPEYFHVDTDALWQEFFVTRQYLPDSNIVELYDFAKREHLYSLVRTIKKLARWIHWAYSDYLERINTE